ncbi:F-box/LRR-repeat protein 25-like [Senna tora]|uniref:F-box/LRR-repeat protein 25-like n=1 Tax=Senna tora TaxID=362788 RepID=A0A835CKV6_9FABA|nr:F-box/LRR-repeat protein 25-like [Senna tora]
MEDRISSLPDEVLHLILSCLNTKLAIQTCVLSKRWRYLWTGISTLHLSSSCSDEDSFSDFLDHVFLSRDHSKTIRHFKISFHMDHDYTSKLVLDFLVTHGRDIQDLLISSHLDETYWHCCDLQQPYWNLFRTWDSLKTLSLQFVSIPVNVEYEFVSLNSLHLSRCQLADDKYRLRLRWEPRLVGNVKITAPRLKEFVMAYTCVEDEVDPHFEIILSFPKLLSLSFEQNEPMRVAFPYRPVLQELFVDYYIINYTRDYHYLINLFGGIGVAKCVTLSEETSIALSEVPEDAKGKQPPFGGIEELKIIFERTKSEMDNNFSFTVPNSVLTYLQSRSITLVYKERRQESEIPKKSKNDASASPLLLSVSLRLSHSLSQSSPSRLTPSR